MPLITSLVGVISGLPSRLRTFILETTAEQAAWMFIMGGLGLIIFLAKNLWAAELDVFTSALLLPPMLLLKFGAGRLFVPARNLILDKLTNRYVRVAWNCYIYAIIMSFSWAVVSYWFVEASNFPFAFRITFLTSFVIEPLAEWGQSKLQQKLEKSGSLYPVLKDLWSRR